MVDRLNKLVHWVELQYDRLKWRLRRRMGIGPVKILSYDGYGNSTDVHLLGRVLADSGASPATETDSFWRNILNTVRRFRSREIPYARVEGQVYDQTVTAQADQEGQFHLKLELETPLASFSDHIWHDVTLTLVEPADLVAEPTIGQILIPPPNVEFGVISDLDDTVIQTGVLDKIQAVRNTFLHNAHTRLPFLGIAAFYQALSEGLNNAQNPIFYVSNMPWNLHDMMRAFFDVHDIPYGPMRLTNLGLTESHFIRPSGHDHKLTHIYHILKTYPAMPFILIGDAGEEDPDIYFEALQTYPSRIKAIYIRDIPGNRNQEAIKDLIVKAADLNVDLVLASDTLVAAEHAAAQGFIRPETLDDIRAEIQQTE